MKRAIARKSKFDPIKLIRPAATDEEGCDGKSKLDPQLMIWQVRFLERSIAEKTTVYAS
jgi:hypothetical protein